MVENQSRLDGIFHALSDQTRRRMLRRLAEKPAAIGELAAPFDMTFAAASKHVKVLERAGLVRREIRGRVHLCTLEAQPLHAGMEWIRFYERYWNERLDDLERLIADDAAAERKSKSADAGSATKTEQEKTS